MGVEISQLNETTTAQNSDVLPIVQNGETKKINTQNLMASKVNKSGDTLTGELNFNNKNDYAIVRKTRTINGVDYKANVGLSAAPSTRMELKDANDNLIGQLDIRADGRLWNGKTNRRLPEWVQTGWGTSLTFEMTGHALVLLNQTDILLLWLAGSGTQLNVTHVFGTGGQATLNGSSVTVKYSDNRSFTGTALIFY